MLTELFAVETAEVRLPLPQSRLDYLELPTLKEKKPGAVIDLYTDVGGEVRHWPARMHRTEGVYDERSRVLYVVARVEDPYALAHPERHPLRIGTFVNANIQGRAIENLVVLPRHILRSGNQLWVIDSDNKLRNRNVETLRAGNDLVYVTAGLKPGELVSLTALDPSFAGAEVEIIDTIPTNELGSETDAMPVLEQPAISAESSEQNLEADSGTS